jgi:hypothetical protein
MAKTRWEKIPAGFFGFWLEWAGFVAVLYTLSAEYAKKSWDEKHHLFACHKSVYSSNPKSVILRTLQFSETVLTVLCGMPFGAVTLTSSLTSTFVPSSEER